VHILEAHVGSVLIRKVLEPVGGHANTPPPVETEFNVAQLVIDAHPPHDPAVPVARENRTGCPRASGPTEADTELAVAVIEDTTLDSTETVRPA